MAAALVAEIAVGLTIIDPIRQTIWLLRLGNLLTKSWHVAEDV
jgi:hypothetical protein